MKALKVNLKNAQETKKLILDKGLLNSNYLVKKENNVIYFPLSEETTKLETEFDSEIVEIELEENVNSSNKDIKEILSNKLTEQEMNNLKTAFDMVGTIAILEIDEDLRHKEKEIAKALLESNKSIKTVLRKDASHEGQFRTQKMKFLAGIDTRETIHTENGVRLKLNVETVYFSPRSSNERKRVYEQVKKGENILVMFSGCAPFPCVISKNTDAKEIVGIEINPQGHKYAVENVKLNKLKNIILVLGDVRKDAPALTRREIKFDRILMPLPKTAEKFLDVTLPLAKKGTIIHLYAFYHEDEFNKAHEEIDKYCKAQNREYKILNTVKCGQFGPQIFRITVDFKLLN